jgi:hypothetical protein
MCFSMNYHDSKGLPVKSSGSLLRSVSRMLRESRSDGPEKFVTVSEIVPPAFPAVVWTFRLRYAGPRKSRPHGHLSCRVGGGRAWEYNLALVSSIVPPAGLSSSTTSTTSTTTRGRRPTRTNSSASGNRRRAAVDEARSDQIRSREYWSALRWQLPIWPFHCFAQIYFTTRVSTGSLKYAVCLWNDLCHTCWNAVQEESIFWMIYREETIKFVMQLVVYG